MYLFFDYKAGTVIFFPGEDTPVKTLRNCVFQCAKAFLRWRRECSVVFDDVFSFLQSSAGVDEIATMLC
jgi:hypothetical protein